MLVGSGADCNRSASETDPLHQPSRIKEITLMPSLAEVNYRPADAPEMSCGTCSNFQGDSCLVVEGPVQAEGVCDVFTPIEGGPQPVDDMLFGPGGLT